VPVGGIMYDDNGEIVSEVVLKDRIHMSTEGIFVVVLTVQRGSCRLLSSPDIISRGFIYLRDSEELMSSIRLYLRQKVATSYKGGRKDIEKLKNEIRDDITQVLYDQTRRTPIVIPVINEIGGPARPGQTAAPAKIINQPIKPRATIRRPFNQPAARPPLKSPAQISFKRKPTGPSAGGLWTR
jgi:ribonuclease J